MATVNPATAIQKKVEVSIKDGKTFSEEVFFLHLESVGNVTSEKEIKVTDGEGFSGAFKQIQFRFDKDRNYIYTKFDNDQKEFDEKYKGTASEFSISGLSAGNAKTVIRTGKTNSANDVSEKHNGPADRVKVIVGGEPDNPIKPKKSPSLANDIEYLRGKDFDKGKYSEHNTGPRIQHSANLDILNRESEAYFKLLKGQESDEMSWGVRGGPHSDGKDVREYKFYMPISGHHMVFAKEYGKDSKKKYDKVEADKANEKGFNLLEIHKGSQTGKMGKEITVDPEKEYGMKVRHYNLDKDGDGKADAVKLEAFVDFKDGNGWQKYIEGEDDGTKLEGPGPLIKTYKDERDHIRVDNCGECSESNHSVYIPGTYKVGLIKGGLGENDKYWPWENVDDNWDKEE